jgi:tetratricopeptide (TPR) repeat protein
LSSGVAALRAAHDTLPASAAITITLAEAERALREMEAALAHYDEVLDAMPTHRDALLGRTFALTHLLRQDDAIASATRLIDLGIWYLADAYYLRAWNRYQLKRHDAAWTDVEQAIQLRSSTEVYTLAGLVAYARQDLETARDRFARAWSLDHSNCSAEQYLGIVQAEQNAWADAGPVFSTAMTCFASAAAKARTELAAIQAADTPPDFKARMTAEQQDIIDESELQAARCAYNGAQAYVRVGQRDTALRLITTALQHAELKPQAEILRRLIDPL